MGLSLPRIAAANLLVAALYFLLAKVSLTLMTVGPYISPLWLPAGLGVSLLAVAGPGLLPGLWLGYAAANSLISGWPWYVAGLIGFGSTASVWLGAVLVRRFLPEGLTGNSRAPAYFLAIAYGSAVLAGLCGPMLLWLFGLLVPGSLDASVIAWWLGDALGIVVLAPAVLEWRAAHAARRAFQFCGWDMVAVMAGTIALAFLTFVADVLFLPNAYVQAALLLPPMMWLVMRCHPAVPFSVNLVVVVGLLWGAAGSLGPLLGVTTSARAYALHGFVLIASVTLLFLAAHIHRVREMTAAARAGEERFRHLTALTSDWYWEQDAEYRFTVFDGPVFGDPNEKPPLLLGKRRWELAGVEPYETSWEAHRAMIGEHRTFVGAIMRYTNPAQRVAYYSISGEPKYDAAGRFTGYRGVGRNVTAEIESREALRASERSLREVADAAFEGLFVHDFGRIVFSNRPFAEIVGYSVDDIVGRPVLDFVAPEEHAHVIQEMAQDATIKQYKTTGLLADGRRIPVEVFGRPFVFRGQPMRIAAIRDDSVRVASEAALASQIAFQRGLLDTMPNPVFYKDAQGRFVGYNRAFCEFFGIGPQDYIGLTVLDLVPNEMGRQFKASDEALFAKPGIQAYEEPIQTPRGRRDVMVYKDVFRDAKGDIGGLVGILIDITERKKIEMRLQRFLTLSPAAIGIVAVSGEVLYMNPATKEIFGYLLADVPTIEAWWELAYPDPAYREDRRTAWMAAVELTLREGRRMFRFDGRVRCADGRDRWIETLASLGEEEIFLVFTDLTEYVGQGPT